jgi:hypothetical protein
MKFVALSVRLVSALVFVLAVVSIATMSAHMVKGIQSPGGATAFVSSPSGNSDLPIPINWAGDPRGVSKLRVVCFNTANTSLERADRPGWPRITAAGFELPGSLSGFALLEPLDGNWELVEGAHAKLNGTKVTLDFAIVATDPRAGKPGQPDAARGLPPEQDPIRTDGIRFCVSGPFPQQLVSGQDATIEQFIAGVVIGFEGVDGVRGGHDFGIWDNAMRVIPLYP